MQKVGIILCEEFPLCAYPLPSYYLFIKLDSMAFSYFMAALNFPTSQILPVTDVTFTVI